MTYEEAFMTGSVAEGTIKGTYAEFFAQDGTKLFSFQRKNSAVEIKDGETQQIVNFGDRNNADVLEYANTTMVLKDGTAIPMINFKDKFGYLIKTGPTSSVFIEANKAMAVRGTDEFTLDVDFPVCRAYQSEAVKGKVPVTLLPDAIDYIKEFVLKKEKHFRVFVSYTKYTNGKWLASYGEEITKQLYEGKTTPDMKIYYDGKAYTTPLDVKNEVVYRDGAKHIPEDIYKSNLFQFSLYRVGCEVCTALLRQDNRDMKTAAQKASELLATFKKKYKKSQLEAYEWLIDTPETREILDKAVNPATGEPIIPYIYVDIQLSQDTVEVFQEKYKILEKNLKGTLYAKKGAFDWYPTNISNAEIEGEDPEGNKIKLNLTDYLKQKKEALDKAKALIAAAGAATIL